MPSSFSPLSLDGFKEPAPRVSPDAVSFPFPPFCAGFGTDLPRHPAFAFILNHWIAYSSSFLLPPPPPLPCLFGTRSRPYTSVYFFFPFLRHMATVEFPFWRIVVNQFLLRLMSSVLFPSSFPLLFSCSLGRSDFRTLHFFLDFSAVLFGIDLVRIGGLGSLLRPLPMH